MDDRQMVNMRRFCAAMRGSAVPLPGPADPDDLGVETRPQRLARAERDGEVFERCRFGDRVSTCYHNPRCAHEVPGFGRFVPGPGPCHICDGEADGTCMICDRPVCDEDAAHKDGDRFCRTCAPHPGGA